MRGRELAPARPIAVVDAGTAVTIDAVDRNSTHLGGLILPGLRLQRSVLLETTADIAAAAQPEVNTAPDGDIFARSTQEALAVSGPFACAAAIDRCVAYLANSGVQPWLVLTGGDAKSVGQWLASPCDICPNLVFEGLAILFEQRTLD
jgi:type III pantothenate kinase